MPVETPRSSDVVATAVWYGGDTNSELYATVEENKNGTKDDSSKYVNNTMSPSSGTTASKNECVYARVNKENPYDKLKQQEHPYAKVGINNNNQYASSQRYYFIIKLWYNKKICIIYKFNIIGQKKPV